MGVRPANPATKVYFGFLMPSIRAQVCAAYLGKLVLHSDSLLVPDCQGINSEAFHVYVCICMKTNPGKVLLSRATSPLRPLKGTFDQPDTKPQLPVVTKSAPPHEVVVVVSTSLEVDYKFF